MFDFECVFPGTMLKVVDTRPFGFNRAGLMDRWLGQVVECAEKPEDDYIHIVEGKGESPPWGGHWQWYPNMFEYIVEEELDLVAPPDEQISILLYGQAVN